MTCQINKVLQVNADAHKQWYKKVALPNAWQREQAALIEWSKDLWTTPGARVQYVDGFRGAIQPGLATELPSYASSLLE